MKIALSIIAAGLVALLILAGVVGKLDIFTPTEETICLQGYRFYRGEHGYLVQMLDRDGHGVPCP